MPNQSQLIAQLVQSLLRGQRGKRPSKWLWLLVIGVVAYVLLAPWIAQRTGWTLPTLGDPPARSERTTRSEGKSERTADRSPPQVAGDLSELLTKIGREEFVSPAGLHYSRGSQHGHRLRHLEAHTRDEPNRVGSHGVYNTTDIATVVKLIDEAYRQAQTGQRTQKEYEEGREVYLVNLGRPIGYVGGESGRRQGNPPAKKLRLVLEGAQVITAFPVK